ncbi:MAG TPA: lipoate--protein ligase family protein [Campylobacterales bacterium]|nr:lipoate--protein ligase family protein [Campylobacterales bacterium]HHS92404.1 lipoate--protein ligase family protein [Campylobacterales bacterium]
MLNSTNKKSFALFSSGKLSAKENMSIDKELIERFKQTQVPSFRVYAWENSFTYGVSQKLEKIQRLEHLETYKENHAQRVTGGGILFHGNDISYSLVIPTSYVQNLSVKESYELICSFLLDFYKSFGLEPHYAKEISTIELSRSDFCQQGFEPYDILIEGKKIGGNAQRRSKAFIFQHGSINFDNSCFSLGYSLEDLGLSIGFEEAKEQLIASFTKRFNIEFENHYKEEPYAS